VPRISAALWHARAVLTSSVRSQRRPVSLIVALIALWFIGMNSAGEGFATVELVRNPLWNALAPAGDAGLEAVRWRAYMQATRDHGSLLLPVGVAQLLLGTVLVFISIRALVARRASVPLFLQVVAANAALAIIGYVMREPVRGAIVDAIVASGIEQRPPSISAREFTAGLRTKLWWLFRVGLALQLVAFAASAYAVARRSSRQTFVSKVSME
jgi:hypothetical protein